MVQDPSAKLVRLKSDGRQRQHRSQSAAGTVVSRLAGKKRVRPPQIEGRLPRGHLRPGGRTVRVRQAVAQAVLDLLKDGKIHFSVDAIAKRTGGHFSTVYKRWPTRADLFREALTLHNRQLEIPKTGSWRRDVHALAKSLAEFASDPVESGMNTAMAANADPEFNKWMVKYWMPVQLGLDRPIERAIARREIPENSNPRVLTTILLAPMLMLTVLMRTRPDPDSVHALAETIVRVSGSDKRSPHERR